MWAGSAPFPFLSLLYSFMNQAVLLIILKELKNTGEDDWQTPSQSKTP